MVDTSPHKNLAYKNYWQRKDLLNSRTPEFPVRRWWPSEGLCEIDRIYWEAIRGAAAILDVGAGNGRMERKFRQAGYYGEYHTQDSGSEFAYTYASLDEVKRRYPVILCLDVLEHLTLDAGMALLVRLQELLEPGGILVLQTANAQCIRNPQSWDMTHLHCYNIADLWAFFTAQNLEVQGYRVLFTKERENFWQGIRWRASAYFISRWLGTDYADNIALLIHKAK